MFRQFSDTPLLDNFWTEIYLTYRNIGRTKTDFPLKLALDRSLDRRGRLPGQSHRWANQPATATAPGGRLGVRHLLVTRRTTPTSPRATVVVGHGG